MSDSFEQLVASALDETGYSDPERPLKILQALRDEAGSEDFAIVGGRVMGLEQKGWLETEDGELTFWDIERFPELPKLEFEPAYRLLPSERADQ